MFTGIVETTGEIERLDSEGTNLVIWVRSSICNELKPDQSLAHDGVCLTVETIADGLYRVSAVKETLDKTALGDWKKGTKINLERAMIAGSRLDGHIVQGHADSTAVCLFREDRDGSWIYRFRFDEDFAPLVIEKGSVSINGISLTVFNVTDNSFDVTIIPYTFEHTGISQIDSGTRVNIEFDVVGKYIIRWQEQLQKKTSVMIKPTTR